ncbi:MAG: hypothetical protein K2H93_00370, partial [Oscillospiraceae bacterium]|nr:hypothetical protein [Oscillospiraceae bacterium]
MSNLKLMIKYNSRDSAYPYDIKLHDIETELTEITNETEDYNLPVMEHSVYNNISYEFYISGTKDEPTQLMINDETCLFSVAYQEDYMILSPKNQNKPFLDSFGAVRIEVTINNKIYATENIY